MTCFVCEFDPRDPRNQWVLILLASAGIAVLWTLIFKQLGII